MELTRQKGRTADSDTVGQLRRLADSSMQGGSDGCARGVVASNVAVMEGRPLEPGRNLAAKLTPSDAAQAPLLNIIFSTTPMFLQSPHIYSLTLWYHSLWPVPVASAVVLPIYQQATATIINKLPRDDSSSPEDG
ncbi:hypothetical protein HYALB_00011548 [Hymenoscyphus albidus]|uniref:Uncharacterized protein n=1 Tax=Hymenoscyphus albidus TaxID=595503 RepID=A0A9N9LLM0_9HELO|nr:hypothetical protein HYALB_00011548 [Hymenoscyphus albidus]